MKLIKKRPPLKMVKPVCVTATIMGIFFLAAGMWIAGLCMLLGAYLFEKNCYCCPTCGKRLNMKVYLPHGARCIDCGEVLKP